MRRRLSLMMLLLYAPAGALVPLFSLRLQELHFSPLQIGLACATQAMAGIIGPLAVGQIADRWFPAERCLAFCSAGAGGLLWLMAWLTEPAAVFPVALAFWLLMVPCLTLGVALAFSHLPDPVRDFGPVRFWGTVGWASPGWLLLAYWSTQTNRDLTDAFRLGGLLAFALSAYALTLPHTPPNRRAASVVAPLAALRLVRNRNFAVYLLSCLLVCVTVPFASQVTPLLLKSLGIPQKWLMPTLSVGQSMELTSLALLPILLLRLGLHGTMRLGLLAWLTALCILSIGEPTWLVIASQTLNGVCVCCFLVAGQVFINGQAHGDIRVSAQSLLSFVSSLGLLLGNLLVGFVRWQVEERFRPTYAVGAGLAALLATGFWLGFRAEEPGQNTAR